MEDAQFFHEDNIKRIFNNITRILLRINDNEENINDTEYNIVLCHDLPKPSSFEDKVAEISITNKINIAASEGEYLLSTHELIVKSVEDLWRMYIFYLSENKKYYRILMYNYNYIIISKYN